MAICLNQERPSGYLRRFELPPLPPESMIDTARKMHAKLPEVTKIDAKVVEKATCPSEPQHRSIGVKRASKSATQQKL